jgi:hypothetical protein
MNLISKQAEKFSLYNLDSNKSYQEFIKLVNQELLQYSRCSHKVQFIETVMCEVRKEYEEHLPDCTTKDDCDQNFYFESIIFFLNELRKIQNESLTEQEFKEVDIIRYRTGIDEILNKLNEIQLSQHFTYDDFSDQFEELKSYFFLNKKSWNQMLAGKLLEMVAGGIITETVSKQIVSVFSSN